LNPFIESHASARKRLGALADAKIATVEDSMAATGRDPSEAGVAVRQ
jgi:hypothetical protein